MASELTTDPVHLPTAVRLPKALQGACFLLGRQRILNTVAQRYGTEFTVNLPVVGRAVIIGDPALVKELFSSGPDLIKRLGNLGEVLGPGSTFSLSGDEHRARRKLMVPTFHGKRVQAYERIIEEEVMREIAMWPEGVEFSTLQPMMRVTVNAILRAVFGAEGAAFDELRALLPPWVALGSRMVAIPAGLRRDLGPWSPWGKFMRSRRRYDAIIDGLILEALADPELSDRGDVLAILLQARYDDGTPLTHRDIADELLTFLVAGHETTATTLAWTIERIRRHPRLLSRLSAEVEAGGSELTQATIWEVQRTRPVIDGALRITQRRIRLGEYVIPAGYGVFASAVVAHGLEESFPDSSSFNPDRFLGSTPGTYTWIPFGGGVHRCVGAAFANMEMTVTLRTLLCELQFTPTNAAGERFHSRGVAIAPGKGGRAVIHRRPAAFLRGGTRMAAGESQ
jgi:cytochrome P450